MIALRRLRRTLLGRDVAVAYAVIMGFYLVGIVEFQPLQIPIYLLIVAYDVVEVVLPVLTPYHPVGFLLFLYLLAIVATAAARRLQSGNRSTVLRAGGGVCLVIGAVSLLFGASVGGPLVTSGDDPAPVVITAIAGGVLLLAGWWLLGRPSIRGWVSRRNE